MMELPTQPDCISRSIKLTFGSEAPIRDAFHMHGLSYRGFIQSTKGLDGQPIPFNSGLARDCLRVLELAPEVMTIIAEPGVILYMLDGKIHRYTPDYLLRLRDGSHGLVEVKYHIEAQTPENVTRYSEVGRLVARESGTFAVLTEKHLRTPVLLKNIPLLERHRHLEVTHSASAWLQKNLSASSHLSLEVAAKQLGRPFVLAAIAQGLVATDFRTTLITDASRLRSI